MKYGLDWLSKRDPFILIGLTGVSPAESRKALAWGHFFSCTKVLVAIALLWEWQLIMLKAVPVWHHFWLVNAAIWSALLIELVMLSLLVSDHRRYIRQNWMLPLIIVLGIPFVMGDSYGMVLFGGLRPFLAIFLLMPSIRLLARFFVDGQLSTTLLAAAVIVVVFGLLVAGVDPNVKSAGDGIWWAAATVSTVGYGDVVPSSPVGRLIGIGLIVMGLGVFVVITANFLALILKREAKEIKKEEQEIEQTLKEVQYLRLEQSEVLNMLNQVNQRLERLEEFIRK